MKHLKIIILSFMVSSFTETAKADVQLLSSTIETARVLLYSDLSDQEQEKVGSFPKFYRLNENWNEGTIFKPTDGFYVKAKVIRAQVATVSSMYSCGSHNQCSERKLNEKVSNLLAYENPRMIYGKYQNKWGFKTESGRMPLTQKFTGHGLISIKQSKDKKIDEVLIGPLPEKPTAILITPYNGYNSNYVISYKL